MTLQDIIGLAISVSMFLIVFALGLHASPRDALALFQRPRLLLRSLFAMNGVMLLVAVIAAVLLDLRPAIEIVLVALAASPVPPVLPSKQMQAGGTRAYAISLLCIASIVAIVFVPVTIELIGRIFGLLVHVPVPNLAQIVFISIMLPLASGMLVRRLFPVFSSKAERPLSIAGTIILTLAALPVLISSWPIVAGMLGQGILEALIVFTALGTLTGHVLGGPDPDERTVLALATGARHPAIAMAIGTAAGADAQIMLALVLFHLVVASLVVIPYVAWRRKRHAATLPEQAQ